MAELKASEQMEIMRSCAVLKRRIDDNLSVIEAMENVIDKYRILRAIDSMMEICADAASVRSNKLY